MVAYSTLFYCIASVTTNPYVDAYPPIIYVSLSLSLPACVGLYFLFFYCTDFAWPEIIVRQGTEDKGMEMQRF